MGASGAGKTTLLNVLSRRNQRNSGAVSVNGHPVDQVVFKRASAFVQQDDIFYPNLTVRETLRFQAELRMDSSLTVEAKHAAVEELIAGLNLTKCANNVIGSVATGEGRGISGGERKRLSFATEILTQPSILFADEPTSGLDTHMAEGVVRTMRQLAQAGRTVLATIHQPSSEVFALFDSLVLVNGGRIVYAGPREEAVNYFGDTFGEVFRCPAYMNPADFLIKMLAIKDPADPRYAVIQSMADTWEASEFRARHDARQAPVLDAATGVVVSRPSDEEKAEADGAAGQADEAQEAEDEAAVEDPAKSKQSSGSAAAASDAADVKLDTMLNHESQPLARVEPAGWFTELGILIRREMLNSSRDPMLTRAKAVQTLILALIVGLLYWQVDVDSKYVQNVSGFLFFVCVNQSFGSLFPVAQAFIKARAVFQREHEAGTVRVGTFFIAKNLSELPNQILFPFIFTTIAYWMAGVLDNGAAYIWTAVIVVMCANVAVSLGYAISCVAPSMEVALALMPVIILPFMLVGGLFTSAESVPVGFRWLQYLSWFNWAFKALAHSVFSRVGALPCADGSTTCPLNSGANVMKYMFEDSNFGREIGILLAMIVGYRILAYLALYLRTRKRQNE